MMIIHAWVAALSMAVLSPPDPNWEHPMPQNRSIRCAWGDADFPEFLSLDGKIVEAHRIPKEAMSSFPLLVRGGQARLLAIDVGSGLAIYRLGVYRQQGGRLRLAWVYRKSMRSTQPVETVLYNRNGRSLLIRFRGEKDQSLPLPLDLRHP